MGVLPAVDTLSESSGDCAVPGPESRADSSHAPVGAAPKAAGKAKAKVSTKEAKKLPKAKAKTKGSKSKKVGKVEEADDTAKGSPEKKDEAHFSAQRVYSTHCLLI